MFVKIIHNLPHPPLSGQRNKKIDTLRRCRAYGTESVFEVPTLL
jgi:hypothetical protein